MLPLPGLNTESDLFHELGLTNKLALVCRVAWVGKSVAVELAREGAHIALCGRDRDAIGRATEAVTAVNGDGALGMVADVGSPTDLDAFVAEAESGFQRRVDIVVWNGVALTGFTAPLPPEAVQLVSRNAWKEHYTYSDALFQACKRVGLAESLPLHLLLPSSPY